VDHGHHRLGRPATAPRLIRPVPSPTTSLARTHLWDAAGPWTLDQALAEARRCLYCPEAPCTAACPTRIDVPAFIRKILTRSWRASARTILGQNALGFSCARVCPVEVLCEGACVLPGMGLPPVRVGWLQQVATERALDAGWHLVGKGPPSGRRVALIGAGPASLACAHELARLGHACTIFERDDLPGGLASHAAAPYKLTTGQALAEVAYVLGIGSIELKTGTLVGRDVAWSELDSSFDAVFLGIGLGADRLLPGLPGASLPGVEGALAFIDRMKAGAADLSGVLDAVVVGGGATAVDLVRELLGLGVPRVTLLYRRDRGSMKGYAHEWDRAVQAGARAEWRAAPVAFEGGAALAAVRCSRLGPDLVPLGGSDFTIPAHRCFLAVGRERIDDSIEAVPGLTFRDGRLVVDDVGFTGCPGWFAGGDCTSGGREVVHAVASGRDAARAIHAHLTALGA